MKSERARAFALRGSRNRGLFKRTGPVPSFPARLQELFQEVGREARFLFFPGLAVREASKACERSFEFLRVPDRYRHEKRTRERLPGPIDLVEEGLEWCRADYSNRCKRRMPGPIL